MNSLSFFPTSSCISRSPLPCVFWQMSRRTVDLTVKNTFSCVSHVHPQDPFLVSAELYGNKNHPLNNCEADCFLQDVFFFSLRGCGPGTRFGEEEECGKAVAVWDLNWHDFLLLSWTPICCHSPEPGVSKESTISIFVYCLNRICHARYRKFGRSGKKETSLPTSPPEQPSVHTLCSHFFHPPCSYHICCV